VTGIMENSNTSKLLIALSRLVNRDYWWRMWIAQEFTVVMKVILLCRNDGLNHTKMIGYDEG
jgi:hypothetical protein